MRVLRRRASIDRPGPEDPLVEKAPGEPAEGTEADTDVEGPDRAPEEAPRRRWPGIRESVRATRAALAPLGRRRILVATVGLMGFAVGGTLLFSGVSFWWTSQPSFCAGCHVMEPYVEAWKRSPHRTVNCESCHLNPGFFGFLGGKISGLQVVMNYIRGEYEDYSFNAAVSNASCLQCHEQILDRNIHASGIQVSHLNIVSMGGRCLSCHSTVAHGEAVPAGAQTHPTMAACLWCHNDQIAPLRCSLCHLGRTRPSPMATEPASVPAAGS